MTMLILCHKLYRLLQFIISIPLQLFFILLFPTLSYTPLSSTTGHQHCLSGDLHKSCMLHVEQIHPLVGKISWKELARETNQSKCFIPIPCKSVKNESTKWSHFQIYCCNCKKLPSALSPQTITHIMQWMVVVYLTTKLSCGLLPSLSSKVNRRMISLLFYHKGQKVNFSNNSF